MTADSVGGQPASAWPLAGQPCKVDCDLHTIARAHNNTFFVRLIGTIGPRVAAVECVIRSRLMCTSIMHEHARPLTQRHRDKLRDFERRRSNGPSAHRCWR